MEYLQNGFCLNIAPGTFPLSTDSILLADFVKLPKQAKVLDLGAGCGTLGLLLCAKDAGCSVTGIELNEAAHAAALENIVRNGLEARLFSICDDLRIIPQRFPSGSYTCCVSNPPYYTGGPASKTAPQARRDDNCTIAELFTAAAWAIRYGGDFYLVHKPERLAEICACASEAGLEPKRLRLVRHDPDSQVSLILLQCRKGGKPGLIWEELCLHNADGTPTESYKKIYHL
ncbi:MAG: methyltransferase [Oscillospiraceae bacterium]|nr:methyltransferase [Oscillospiraceae bacterium]